MSVTDAILMEDLPGLLGELPRLPDPSGEHLQVRVTGDDPGVFHWGASPGGDLTFHLGPCRSPRFEIDLDATALRAVARGEIGRAVVGAPGWAGLRGRPYLSLVLDRRAAARSKRLRGDLCLALETSGSTAEVVFRALGRGPDRCCRVRTGVETLVAFAAGLVDPRGWARANPGRIDGDPALFLELVSVFLPPPPSMPEFLFAWHRPSGTFPVRFHVRGRFEAHDDPEGVQGTVRVEEAEAVVEALRRAFREPEWVVERMAATSWATVEENFPGLYTH